MATTNLGMTKPAVGADSDTWGGELNADLDLIDAFAGKLMPGAEVSVASAAVTDIGAAASTAVAITGTTTITSFGTVANCIRFVRFTGALTLTHNASSLILLGGANHATAAGDTAIYRSDGSGNWREVAYSSAAYIPSAHTGTGSFVHASNASMNGTTLNSVSLTSPSITSGASLGSGSLSISGGGGIQISGGGNAGITIFGGGNSGLNISNAGASIEGYIHSGNGFTCAGFGYNGSYSSIGCGSDGSFTISSGPVGPIFCRAGGGSSGVDLVVGATSWSSSSDERQKTDLVPIANAIAKIATLRAVTGRYITDTVEKSRPFLIAQDVQKVLPGAVSVSENSNGGTAAPSGMLNLAYTDVIPLLVAGIKELAAAHAALEIRTAGLEPIELPS